jgi:hypothetical protein
MNNKNRSFLFKAVLLIGTLLGAHSAFADCPAGTSLAPLASDIANGTTNTTICVDQLNYLTSNHFVFNIDTPVTADGIPVTAGGTPLAFKHMWLMGSANIAFLKTHGFANPDGTVTDPLVPLTNPDPAFPNGVPRMSIIGIIHGSALSWALSDAWWEAQVDDDGHQLYPDGNPNKAWFAKIQAMQAKGMDIKLEVCGVTLEGAGLTRDDVYVDPNTGWRIPVNQGAFGRMSHLHQVGGYAVVSEGWEDNDRMMHH